jgi:hypothetical protein
LYLLSCSGARVQAHDFISCMSSLVPKLLWLSYTSIGWRARRLLQNQILMTDTQTTHTVGHTTVPIVDIRQRVADRISVLSVGASLCFIVRLVLYSGGQFAHT